MRAFLNGVIYKVSAHLSRVFCVKLVTVYLFTLLPYILRSNVLIKLGKRTLSGGRTSATYDSSGVFTLVG